MKPSEVKPGDRFGILTVLSIQQHYYRGQKQGKEAICLCDCGNQKTTILSSLLNGRTTSCGCLQRKSQVNNGSSCIRHAHLYLNSHPEIRQQNIAKANEYLKDNPGIRQENGRKAIKHTLAYLASHPEIRQENGRKTIKYAQESQRRDPNSESSLQKEYRLFLEQNNIPYEAEFLLESSFLSHYFDFKVNDFLIEIHGDIYHSTKYENLLNPSAKVPPTTFKSPDYHKSLLDLATKYGFRLIQLWEHSSSSFNKQLLFSQLTNIADINSYVEYINNQKVICNDYGFQVSGKYLPDPGRWISTSSHEIVSEFYEKGKVLVFNSGYIVIY